MLVAPSASRHCDCFFFARIAHCATIHTLSGPAKLSSLSPVAASCDRHTKPYTLAPLPGVRAERVARLCVDVSVLTGSVPRSAKAANWARDTRQRERSRRKKALQTVLCIRLWSRPEGTILCVWKM
jgi:hypothetical protein